MQIERTTLKTFKTFKTSRMQPHEGEWLEPSGVDHHSSGIDNVVTNMTNSTAHIHAFYCNGASVIYTLIIVNSLLVLTGVFNNFLVALVVWKTKQMQNSTNLLLANNAIAEVFYLIASGSDLIMLVLFQTNVFNVSHVVNIIKMRGPLSMLVIAPYLVAATSLALLSIERYNALCNPMKIQRRLGKRSTKFCMLTMWLVTIILVLPVTVNLILRHGYIMDINIFIYYCVMCESLTTILGCIIVNCYGRIIYQIYISKTIFNQTCNATISEDMKAKKNVVKMLFSITLTFCVAKLPVAAFGAIMLFIEPRHINSQMHCLTLFIKTLGHVSAFLNPIVYLVFNSNYRGRALRLLKCSVHNRVARRQGSNTGSLDT